MEKRNLIGIIGTATICGLLAIALGKYLFIPLFFFISIFCLFFSKRLYNSYFSPIGIMGVSWLLPSLFTFLDSKWELKEITWFVILGSFIMFFLGALFVSLKQKFSLKFGNEIKLWEKKFLDKAILVLFLIGIIGFFANFLNILSEGEISIYLERGFRAGEQIFAQNTFTNYLYFLNMLVVPLCVFRLKTYGRNLLFIFIGLFSFIFLFFHGVRGTLIFTLIISIFGVLLSVNQFKLKYAFLILLLTILSFGFVSIGRNPAIVLEQGAQGVIKTIFKQIYLYIAPNYANLEKQILELDFHYFGLASLNELFRGRLAHLMNISFPLYLAQEEKYNGEYYNIGTYLRPLWTDFGIVGITLLPFLLGAATTFIFLNFLKNPSQINLLIYSIIATMLFFSFWHLEFLRPQFLYFISVLYFTDLIRKRIKKREQEINLKGS